MTQQGRRTHSRAGARDRDPRRPKGVRPTSALVRTALFNHLGGIVAGTYILDLFAGTGSLGLEALRRGARRGVFIDHDARLVAALRARLDRDALAKQAEVWQRDALAAIRELGSTKRRFDLIFIDPPYGEGWIPRCLTLIDTTQILAPEGIVVAEGHWRDRPDEQDGWICTREARYGETVLWYFVARKEEAGV